MFVDLGKGKFVIDTVADPHALAAMQAYADACGATVPELAGALRRTLGITSDLPAGIESAWRWFHLAQSYAQTQPNYSKQAWNHIRTALLSVQQRHSPAAPQPKPSVDPAGNLGAEPAPQFNPASPA